MHARTSLNPWHGPRPPGPQIRRFVKYRLGEGLEKRSSDFAAEVAQQTQAKAAPAKAPEPKKEEAPAPKAEVKPVVQVRGEAGARRV